LAALVTSALFAMVLAWPATTQAQSGQRTYPQSWPEYGREAYSAHLRINFDPTDAQVYVDGSLAGRVSEFDGVFQSLRLAPGRHVVTVYRPGFRTERYTVDLGYDRSRTITGRLERLRPGQVTGPPPMASGRGRGGWDDRGSNVRLGTISLRVLPGDAEIFVNGSRRSWQRQSNRFALDLQPGHHRLEVRRAGYAPYYREVDVRAGATVSLDVTLRRGL
jgi:hypothetical protein